MKNVTYAKVNDGYVCNSDYVYLSPRYNKTITVHKGFYSDGATNAIDLDTDAWWVHDVLCRYCEFDDHTPCSVWQASCILSDLLYRDGFKLQSFTWKYATYLWGATKGIVK